MGGSCGTDSGNAFCMHKPNHASCGHVPEQQKQDIRSRATAPLMCTRSRLQRRHRSITCAHCEKARTKLTEAHIPAVSCVLGAFHALPKHHCGVVFILILWLYTQPQATHLYSIAHLCILLCGGLQYPTTSLFHTADDCWPCPTSHMHTPTYWHDAKTPKIGEADSMYVILLLGWVSMQC